MSARTAAWCLVLLAGCRADCRSACERAGGVDVEYNCRNVTTVSPVGAGYGIPLGEGGPYLVTERECEHKCVKTHRDGRSGEVEP